MDKFIFLHQQKCGGTTIFSYLSQCFPENEILYCYYNHHNPENQKKYLDFDNLFESLVNDNESLKTVDIKNYKFITGHNIINLLENKQLQDFKIICNFRSPFKIFRSLYFQKIGEIIRGEGFHRCKGIKNNFIKVYEDVIFGPRHFFDFCNDVFLRKYVSELYRIDLNKIDYLVEAEDTLDFINFLKNNGVKDNFKKSCEIFRINRNPLSNKEKYFNVTEEEFKNKFKMDYELYEKLKLKKWVK